MKEELQQILTEYANLFNAFLDIEDWKLVILGDINNGQDLAAVCVASDMDSDFVFINELWVDRALRNMHVATFMMNLFELLVVNQGYKGIRLWARGEGNLVDFYEKLGYKQEVPERTIMIKNISELLQRNFRNASQFERCKLDQLRALMDETRNQLLTNSEVEVKR